MAIDPDLYEKVSGRRLNDAAYAGAVLASASGAGRSMSFWEARSRGRRWLAISFGLVVALVAGSFVIPGL